MTTLLARLRRCERGATMVEMALVTGTALVLILGMVQFAVGYYFQHNLLLAVEQAGRWAMINNKDTSIASDAASYVCNVLMPGGASCTNVAAGGACTLSPGLYCANATSTTSSNGTTMLSLTASYRFSFINITGSAMTLTGQTTVPLD